jgi:hypothetical protein
LESSLSSLSFRAPPCFPGPREISLWPLLRNLPAKKVQLWIRNAQRTRINTEFAEVSQRSRRRRGAYRAFVLCGLCEASVTSVLRSSCGCGCRPRQASVVRMKNQSEISHGAGKRGGARNDGPEIGRAPRSFGRSWGAPTRGLKGVPLRRPPGVGKYYKCRIYRVLEGMVRLTRLDSVHMTARS